MKCPVCKEVDLVMSERQGVEVDYCPTCRGVWLDRGELDKIIERSFDRPEFAPPPSGHYEDDDHDHGHGEHGREHHGQWRPGYPRRRGSWLSNLLDFGD